MALPKVSESYPDKYARASNYPLGVPIPVVIRDVTVADLGYGPRYCLEA